MTRFLDFLGTTTFLVLIMCGVVVEALVLVLWHQRTGHGPRPLEVCTFLGAGLAFVVALYAARAHDGTSATFVIALTGALVLHVWHLAVLSRR